MLRYYQEQRLVQPALSANGYRSYGSDDVPSPRRGGILGRP
jgi:DNA-binding transcriptional MerR regulator